jgi:hypothetical protein
MSKRISRNIFESKQSPADLTEEQIWDVFRQHIPEDRQELDLRQAEFDWDDLEGKIIGKYVAIINPRPYNSLLEAGNPMYFQVIQFADEEGSMLLFEPYIIESEEKYGYLVYSYYFSGKEVLFSGDLF